MPILENKVNPGEVNSDSNAGEDENKVNPGEVNSDTNADTKKLLLRIDNMTLHMNQMSLQVNEMRLQMDQITLLMNQIILHNPEPEPEPELEPEPEPEPKPERPRDMPQWLYEVIIRNNPKEQSIMMNQLVRNQGLEFYTTSPIEPLDEYEKTEKKYLVEHYNFNSTLDNDCFEKTINGIYQTTNDICVGRINGKYCNFSTDDFPAKKLYKLIDQGDFKEYGQNIKNAYKNALKKEKEKYNQIVRSFNVDFLPDYPLEHSKENMQIFWERMKVILYGTT